MTLSIEVINNIYLIIGLAFGGLLTVMITSANERWRRGRGLRRVPEKVERENVERIWKAKNDQAQGCREMLRAAGQITAAAVIIFFLGLFLNW